MWQNPKLRTKKLQKTIFINVTVSSMYCLFFYKNHQNTPLNICKNKTYQNCSKLFKPEYNNNLWFNTFKRANIRNINLFLKEVFAKNEREIEFGIEFYHSFNLLTDLSFNPYYLQLVYLSYFL